VSINLDIYDIYDPVLDINPDIYIADLAAIWAAPFASSQKLEALSGYFSGFNAIRIYADPIYDTIGAFYKTFDQDAQSDVAIAASVPQFDCEAGEGADIGMGRISYKCTNGDSIMDGYDPERVRNDSEKLGRPDAAKMALLKAIIDDLKVRDIRPVIILNPHRNTRYGFDLDQLGKALDVDIIDYTNVVLRRRFWGDESHLNAQGRAAFSDKLSRALKPLVEESKK
jgi:hypothetical protein